MAYHNPVIIHSSSWLTTILSSFTPPLGYTAGAWCIVSSPLILGLDLTDTPRVNAVWDIITNREAISVNQEWAGQPGRLLVDAAGYQVIVVDFTSILRVFLNNIS